MVVEKEERGVRERVGGEQMSWRVGEWLGSVVLTHLEHSSAGL